MNENVRKVFDILGVEPNERFKIEGIDEANYYIDEKLYVIREIEGRLSEVSDKGLSNILNGNFKIIKTPKTKKLRDLTEEEYEKMWNTICFNTTCRECMFNNVQCEATSKECWTKHKDLYSDKFLDQEIEVVK